MAGVVMRPLAREAQALSLLARTAIGCETCGSRDPWALDWDHLDPTRKRANVADMVKASGDGRSRYSLSAIVAEMAACRVLCASCHRQHTAAQRGRYALHEGPLSDAVADALAAIVDRYRG